MTLNSFEKFALKVISSLVLSIIVIFSLNIYSSGATSAGGGFQSGSLFASGIILYEFINGKRFAFLKRMQFFQFFGIMLFITTGLASIFFGGTIFEYTAFSKMFGHKIGIFFLETAVFLVVFLAIIKIYRSL
jgi:multisubunit Na+/H+ antiporter MnhB subunit